jgi:hypothetical protein
MWGPKSRFFATIDVFDMIDVSILVEKVDQHDIDQHEVDLKIFSDRLKLLSISQEYKYFNFIDFIYLNTPIYVYCTLKELIYKLLYCILHKHLQN